MENEKTHVIINGKIQANLRSRQMKETERIRDSC